ncbi:MAG: alpha-amylase family glycosyl hydrolase [Segetibacter sp.]
MHLLDGAHSRGMAVILDWVVNQTSWDHPWITQHPDWYIRDANGVIQQLGYILLMLLRLM